MAIKAILFDLWGTLIETGTFPTPIQQTKKILGQFRTPFGEYVRKLETSFMTQKHDDLRAAFEHVCKEFDVSPTDYNRVERLIGLWNKNKFFAKPYEDTEAVLKELKKDYKLALISNTHSGSEEILDKYNLREYFDAIMWSFEQGMLKDDEKMFKKTLKELGVKKEEAVMVGDSMASDVKGAENAGIRAILIDRRDKRDYDTKVMSLSELKNKIKEIENG